MDAEEARHLLSGWDGEEESPISVTASVLARLTIQDLPDGVTIEVGEQKDDVLNLDWSGHLGRDGDSIYGEADYT